MQADLASRQWTATKGRGTTVLMPNSMFDNMNPATAMVLATAQTQDVVARAIVSESVH